MIPKSIDCNTANFRILSGRIIFRYKWLNLGTHGILARYSCEASSFCPTACFEKVSLMFRFNPTQLRNSFALSRLSVQPFLESLQRWSLFTSD
jgi:hypothetical protein